jgi:hypothetical protein
VALVFALARLCEESEACFDEAIQDVDFSLLMLTSWIASSKQASLSSQRRAKAKAKTSATLQITRIPYQ